MKAYFSDEAIALEFEGAEKELLVLSLLSSQAQYEIPFEELPDTLKKYWTGTLTTHPAADLQEAAEDLAETRLSWRSERQNALDRWLGPNDTLADNQSDLFSLEGDDIELFLSILNDRRLSLAAVHHFDDHQLERNPAAIAEPDRQRALWEIHFLAFVMENCLQAMRHDGEE